MGTCRLVPVDLPRSLRYNPVTECLTLSPSRFSLCSELQLLIHPSGQHGQDGQHHMGTADRQATKRPWVPT